MPPTPVSTNEASSHHRRETVIERSDADRKTLQAGQIPQWWLLWPTANLGHQLRGLAVGNTNFPPPLVGEKQAQTQHCAQNGTSSACPAVVRGRTTQQWAASAGRWPRHLTSSRAT